LLAAILAVASCGGSPPPPPTVINLTLRATADVNPGPSGNAAPIAVRYYQLASPAAFNGAEFFQLFDQDEATLKGDGIKHEEYVLAPGETKTAKITPDPTVKVLGLFAAYRDFQKATWRKVWEIPQNKTTDLTVIAGHDGIAIAPPPDAKP
jgi:type VI secretion system protein VasD